jgi:hypothetical protein
MFSSSTSHRNGLMNVQSAAPWQAWTPHPPHVTARSAGCLGLGWVQAGCAAGGPGSRACSPCQCMGHRCTGAGISCRVDPAGQQPWCEVVRCIPDEGCLHCSRILSDARMDSQFDAPAPPDNSPQPHDQQTPSVHRPQPEPVRFCLFCMLRLRLQTHSVPHCPAHGAEHQLEQKTAIT